MLLALNIGLFLLAVALALWQFYTISRMIILSKAIMQFREMRYKAAELLSQKLLDEKGNIYEKSQLYNFIVLTTYAINHFDKIGTGLVKPKFFYILLLRIECPFNSTNYIAWETSEMVLKFRARFVSNLHNAFRIIPFFRFQVIARLLIMLSKFSIKIGLTRMSKNLTKEIQSYLKLENKYEELSNTYY